MRWTPPYLHCRNDTTVVAVTMVRGDSRYIQEWLTWYLFVGYSHIVVYYEDPEDGTLDGEGAMRFLIGQRERDFAPRA